MSKNQDHTAGWEARAVRGAIDSTGLKFVKPLPELMAALGEPTFDESGIPYVRYDGEILPLADATLRFAYDRREFVDGRTLPRAGAGTSRPGLESKADYDTPAAKAKRIEEIGIDAWEMLPLTGVTSSEIRSKREWYRLPTPEKVRRLAADPDAFKKLPDTDPQTLGAMVNGSRTNHAALERIKQIRPASR